jgi:hypothetical protein
MENRSNPKEQAADAKWITLYRAGALAPLIALILYSSQFIIMIFGDPFPVTVEGWFALAQRNKLLALWYLNALDIVSITLLGIMFLALYVTLRRVHPSWMLIALYFAMLGAVVFIVPRVLMLSLLPLSDLHVAATTEAQRSMYLTAGETLSHVSTASPQTLGVLFMAVADLIVSAISMRSQSPGRASVIGKATAYVGVARSVVALANYISRLIAPSIAAILMPFNGLLWILWWLGVSRGLFKLAKIASGHEADSGVG